jgi:hypothetical protein
VFLRGFSLQPARPGSGGVIVAPAGPPTPLPYVPAARFGSKNCPVGIGEALHRHNCRVYDAWRARKFIA